MKKRKQQVPKHPGFKFLAPWLGPTKEPETLEDQLVEYIDGTLMFDGYPGFEEGVLIVTGILEECNVDPHSDLGKRCLHTYIAHALEELYGDFDRFGECARCGEPFKPAYTIEYINDILGHNIRCPECKAGETG